MKITAWIARQYMEACTHQKRLDPKTVKAYRIDMRQFMEYAGAADFSRETVQAYVVHLNKRYKPRTVKRKIAVLRAFSRWMEEEGLLPLNPFTGWRLRVQEPRLLPRTVPLRGIERLLSAAYTGLHRSSSDPARRESLRDAAALELLFATGMRVSELCSLRPSDLDLREGRVRIYGKGAKERLIQLTNTSVLAALRRYLQAYQPAPEGPLFLNRHGGRFSEQSVRLLLERCAKAGGLTQRVTPHMLRHSLATLLLEADVDIRYIQQLLGHSSIVTTQIYTHTASAKQRELLLRKHPRNLMHP